MDMDINKDNLGNGWKYPLQIDGRGGIALSRHEDDIKESIRIILSTAKGERHMRPDFGCDIHKIVFAPNNATSWGLASHYVEEVMEIDPQPDPMDISRLLINIKYRIKATNDERNLVYPFYIIPGRS